MRSKFPNHARNVWDRAVALLPRVDQFWYKYSYMEVRGQRAEFQVLQRGLGVGHVFLFFLCSMDGRGLESRYRHVFFVLGGVDSSLWGR